MKNRLLMLLFILSIMGLFAGIELEIKWLATVSGFFFGFIGMQIGASLDKLFEDK